VEITEQTEAQFKAIHGEQHSQSRTAKACFDVLFNAVHRGVAANEHGITEQTISTFIRNNGHKHTEKYLYVQKGKAGDTK